MLEKNIARTAMILDTNSDSTISTNIVKLIKILFLDNQNKQLNLTQVRVELINQYDLEFTTERIYFAVCKRKKEFDFINGDKADRIEKEAIIIKLSKKQVEKLKSTSGIDKLDQIINKYIDKFNITDYKIEDIRELINRFIYSVINENIETLKSFINQKKYIHKIGNSNNYKENEKKIINDFLNWNDKEKNIYLFNILSYSIDYCMMSANRDQNSFKQIFAGKKFFLDSNVIMRMVGLDNLERKQVITSFIRKCKSSGIKIYFTNFTELETYNTIESQLDSLKAVTKGKPPVSKKYYEEFTGMSYNSDLLDIYIDWHKNSKTSKKIFSNFVKYIKNELFIILKEFRKRDCVTYRTLETKEFLALANSLKDYKTEHKTRFTNNSIDTDINNFMFLMKRRSEERGESFYNVNNYLISTDKNFCDWSKIQLDGTVPIVVKPSVWHSLLLKFRGRAVNDYKAFTLFLNIQYRTEESDFNVKQAELFSIVNNLDEPKNFREEILREISENLKNENGKFHDEEDNTKIVKEATNSVIEKRAREIYKEEVSGKINLEIKNAFITVAQKSVEKRNSILDIVKPSLKIIFFVMLIGFTYSIIAKRGIECLIDDNQVILWGMTVSKLVEIGGIIISTFFALFIEPIIDLIRGDEKKTKKLVERKANRLLNKYNSSIS